MGIFFTKANLPTRQSILTVRLIPVPFSTHLSSRQAVWIQINPKLPLPLTGGFLPLLPRGPSKRSAFLGS